jgi:cytidylate kinase
VRVTRPFEQRVAWLMEHLGTEDRDAAEAEVRRSDHAHATRMNAQFGITWGDPLLYDLVLNTSTFNQSSAVELICQAAQVHSLQPEVRDEFPGGDPLCTPG